jgi:hypothetical protein
MINKVLVSKPAKKEGKPQVIDLQEYAISGKAGSVSGFGINKAKEIADFINARSYYPSWTAFSRKFL